MLIFKKELFCFKDLNFVKGKWKNFWNILFDMFFVSCLLLWNPKSQITIEARHKILVTLVFFMTIFQVEKINTPSIIHKLNKKRGKWREMTWRKRRCRVWFRFTYNLQCEFYQNNNILLQQHWPQGLQIGLPSW